ERARRGPAAHAVARAVQHVHHAVAVGVPARPAEELLRRPHREDGAPVPVELADGERRAEGVAHLGLAGHARGALGERDRLGEAFARAVEHRVRAGPGLAVDRVVRRGDREIVEAVAVEVGDRAGAAGGGGGVGGRRGGGKRADEGQGDEGRGGGEERARDAHAPDRPRVTGHPAHTGMTGARQESEHAGRRPERRPAAGRPAPEARGACALMCPRSRFAYPACRVSTATCGWAPETLTCRRWPGSRPYRIATASAAVSGMSTTARPSGRSTRATSAHHRPGAAASPPPGATWPPHGGLHTTTSTPPSGSGSRAASA